MSAATHHRPAGAPGRRRPPKVVVVGAGLGGLAAALRLQGAGCDVTVLEQRSAPGGRASQLRTDGYTWDTGPSLITMPWVLEEAFAAGGLDLHAEVRLRRLDPLYRIRWAGEARAFDFHADRAQLREQVARFDARDAARVDGFLDALRPIYEDGILAAGRRAFGDVRSFAALLPRMARLGAIVPLHRFVAHWFRHPRVREAFSFHSLFIGGDPFRVPAIYGALAYLQVLDGGWYADGGVYSLVEAMARPLDVRCGARVEAIEPRAGGAAGVGGADRGRRRHLQRRRPAHPRAARQAGAAAAAAADDVVLSPVPGDGPRAVLAAASHAARRADGYRDFIRTVTRGRGLPRTFSTYVHAPARTEAAMAPAGGDSLAVLLPVPNLRADVAWERAADGLRDALVADLERTLRPRGARRLGARRAPDDAGGLRARVRRRRRQRVRGRADAPSVRLLPRAQPRRAGALPRRRGNASGRGDPGRAARGRGDGRPRAGGGDPVTSTLVLARSTTNRVARTFSLACRLLPRGVRDDVYLLYLVFRTLDDLVDEGRPDAPERVGAVEAWAAGEPAEPTLEVRILESLAARHDLPRQALSDFCAGMRQDLVGADFLTEADVDRYCYRVAGTVGLVMASVLGTVRFDRARPAAAALGMAMQRTNILRDIDEDAANGRVYVAREAILRCGGLEPGRRELLAARPDPARRRAVRARPGGDRRPAPGQPRDRRRGRDVPRAAAPARARGLRRAPGPRRRPPRPQAARGRHRGMARVTGLRPVRTRRLTLSRRVASRGLTPWALGALAAAQVAYGLGSRPPRATRAIVALMLATSALEARRAGDGRAVAAAGAVGFAAELVGVATGRPFGHYSYSSQLGPRVGGVPLLAAAAWAMMARPAWVTAGRLSARRSRRIVLAAGALTAWDVFLDPRMAREGYWTWPGGGRYEGVPASNFAGWFVTGLAVFAAYAALAREGEDDRGAGALRVDLAG